MGRVLLVGSGGNCGSLASALMLAGFAVEHRTRLDRVDGLSSAFGFVESLGEKVVDSVNSSRYGSPRSRAGRAARWR